MLVLIYIWVISPNQDEKAIHQATLCNIIRQNKTLSTAEELFKQVEFTYGNSTPSYAYHKPKFYQKYTHNIIKHYLTLKPEQQTQAQTDYQRCRALLNQK